MPPKKRLMTPGPTEVAEPALLAMARQVIHHRSPEFQQILAEVQQGLKYTFATENDIAILTSSGTGAMEAAVVNLVPQGAKILVLNSGKFAERWKVIAERFGIETISYDLPWGEPFDPLRVAELLKEHPDTVAVFGTLMETSTGVGHPIQAIGEVIKPTNALFVVDGISGVGVMECRTDEWGIDILAVGSQKALRTPPGLAFLAISDAAWRQIESVPNRFAFYFDLLAYRKALKQSDTPYTPAIPLILSLAESLRQIRAEGIESIWSKARLLSKAMRAGIEKLGLRLAASAPADGMTAVFFPENIDGKLFLKLIDDRYGLKLAGGQGPFKGIIFRIAHMGITDELDVITTLAAIELVLVELGKDVKLGASTAAALAVLAQDFKNSTTL